MNIALIFPRFTGPYGGERLLLNLAYHMGKHNSITIYTHSYKALDKALTKNLKIVEGFYPPINNHQIATLLDLFLMPLLTYKIKKNHDILLPIGWQSTFATFLYKIFKTPKQKVIYYCLEPPRIAYDLKKNNINTNNPLKKMLLLTVITIIKFVDKISVNSVDYIISISDWTYNQVKKVYHKQSLIIYPGVEVERFNKFSKNETRKKLGISENKKIFLSVSKLHIRKRLDLAIKVFEKEGGNNSIFFIVGEGPSKDAIEQLIRKKSYLNIKLLGKLSDEQVAIYMKASDYFIFTAQNEPFGIAPLEAALSGCEVIPYGIKYRPKNWQDVAKEHLRFYKKLYDSRK